MPAVLSNAALVTGSCVEMDCIATTPVTALTIFMMEMIEFDMTAPV
jgi:hypothetical protein